jgi:hypothetical protein
MKRSTRTILAFFLGICFIIFAPYIILKSQGYIFDSENLKFTKAGGIFLKTIPQQTTILAANKIIQSQNSIIYNGVLISDLVPKEYFVEVSASYLTNFNWSKYLQVEPLTVSKATRIVLPISRIEATSTEIFASNFDNLYPLSSTEFLINSSSAIWQATLMENDSTSTTTLKFIADFQDYSPLANQKVKDIKISANRQDLLILASNNNGLLITSNKITLLSRAFQNFLTQTSSKLTDLEFYFNPLKNEELIIINKSQEMYAFNTYSFAFYRTPYQDILAFSKENNNNNLFLTTQGFIYSLNYANLSQEPIPIYALPIYYLKNYTDINYLDKNLIVLWEKNGQLVLVDLKTNQIETLSKNAVLIKPTLEKFVILEKDSLKINFISEVFDDLKYQKGETIVLLNNLNSSQIKEIYFTNNNWYLVLIANNKLIIVEIDKRNPINHWEIPLEKIDYPLNLDNNSGEFKWLSANKYFKAKIFPY